MTNTFSKKAAAKLSTAGDKKTEVITLDGSAEEAHVEIATDESTQTIIYAQSDAKRALTELNNRLANYIDKVRALETENARLMLKIREIEVEYRARENHRNESKQECDELRRQYEVANAARIRADVEKKKVESELLELQSKIEKKDGSLQAVIDDRDKLQERLTRAKNDLNLSEARVYKIENQLEELKNDLSVALKQNDTLKIQLEDETVLRAELEDRIDAELGKYNRLLESEEARLHIRTPTSSHDGSRQAKDLEVDIIDEPTRPPAVVRTSLPSDRKRSHVN